MAAKSKGLTRNEILEATGLPNAGSATRVLDELEQSDFIRRYTSFGQKKRDEMYQLTDAYTLFYFISCRWQEQRQAVLAASSGHTKDKLMGRLCL